MIDDFQKLPPQAVPVIRYLNGRERAAAGEIARETGLSERAFGKAIRALVTRRFAEMPSPGEYRLSARGREALAALESASEMGTQAPPAPVAPDQVSPQEFASAPAERRVSVLVAQEWVRHLPAKLMVGFDAAPEHAPSGPLHLTLRVKARGCEVEPREHALDVPSQRAAGPVQFRVTPFERRAARVQIEVLQGAALLGGLYFEVPVRELPTPLSAQFHALGAPVSLAPRD